MDEALRGVEVLAETPGAVNAKWVQYDSRRVEAGDVFVAMAGGSTDGNRYIDSALQRGAAAVVTDSREAYEARTRCGQNGAAFFLVRQGRRALAGIAANVLGHPERALKLSAVTGTNGKTTTAWLLEQMLRAAGRKTVLIGTIETHVGDEVRESAHTTPEASDIVRVFADGAAAAATEAVMEMSSHALDQERVWGLPVDVGIFTNLTQDHLDYHGTMERYFEAKLRLFEGVGAVPPRAAVINLDDNHGGVVEQAAQVASRVYTYGIERTYGIHGIRGRVPDYRAENIRIGEGGTSFEFVTPDGAIELESRLHGRVNIYNLLAASCAALARGMRLEQIAEAAPKLKQVPGRFQVVAGSRDAGFTVVVDYAHTDDALRNLIALGRELVRPRGGRVITLFGCGGDRDRTKRPKMGRAAGEGSDVVVLTSDNPRSENPAVIIEEALAGVRETQAERVVEPDRAAAIALAIARAKAGDIVLLAGKGHEKVQEIGGRKMPFDDVAIAAEVLRQI